MAPIHNTCNNHHSSCHPGWFTLSHFAMAILPFAFKSYLVWFVFGLNCKHSFGLFNSNIMFDMLFAGFEVRY